MRKQASVLIFALLGLMLFSGLAPAQSRASVSASEVNGTFRKSFSGKYKSSSSEIKIFAIGGGKLQVALDLIYPYTMRNGEFMANTGQLNGYGSISGDTAIYDMGEYTGCTITIKFVRPGTIKVSQEGTDAGCGFGHNVTSAGTYKKVSSKKPKFD